MRRGAAKMRVYEVQAQPDTETRRATAASSPARRSNGLVARRAREAERD
jgi:hypothetical protein